METTATHWPPGLILLDVYETLLDMSDVKRRVNGLLGTGKGYTLWFELLLQYSFFENCIGPFHGFAALSRAALQMTAQVLRQPVEEQRMEEVLQLMKHLPLNEGVQRGLSLLYDKGYRLAALTNSPEKIVRERMEKTGLISYFESVLSAETVKKFKPAPEVYQWAFRQLGVQPGQVLTVTAHGWEVAGALQAGMQVAYLQHPGQALYPLAPPPTLQAKDLLQLAEQLPPL